MSDEPEKPSPAPVGDIAGVRKKRDLAGLSQYHLDNWPDSAFKEHIPAVRKAIAAGLEAAEALSRMSSALEPFANSVFNDNGDITVNYGNAGQDDYIRAYFTLRGEIGKEVSEFSDRRARNGPDPALHSME